MRILKTKIVTGQIPEAILVGILFAAPPVAAQVRDATSVAAARPTRSWRVKYMGGPAELARGTQVSVRVSGSGIVYKPEARRIDTPFFIPTAAVSEVSGELITGVLDEKVFGEDDLDYLTPCEGVPRVVARIAGDDLAGAAFGGCLTVGMGAEAIFGTIDTLLSFKSFKDHFVRITWQEKGGADPEVVFKVSGRDYPGFLEALQSATSQYARGAPQEESPQGAPHASLSSRLGQSDRPSREALLEGSAVERCLADRTPEKLVGLPVLTLDLTGSCAAIRKAHDRLLAKSESE